MSRREDPPKGTSARRGVSLAPGETGSRFLHRVLREAIDRHPHVLGPAGFPERPEGFRKRYGDAVVRFEATRAAAAERVEFARAIVRRAHEEARFVDPDGGETTLAEALERPGEPLELETVHGRTEKGLEPRIPYGEKVFRGDDIDGFLEGHLRRNGMTRAAAEALRWVFRHPEALDLSGRKFAVLGAAAELSPVPLLLEGGATVLWIDVKPPPEELLRGEFAGTLLVPRNGADLLTQPCDIRGTLEHFAEGEPIDLGLFAYAAGGSQEWRLTQAMDAIARSLPPGVIRSVGLFVSPTSPGPVEPEDESEAERHWRHLPIWQSAFQATGLLKDGRLRSDGLTYLHTVVSLQGTSYQAAQYVAKILAAETYGIHGIHTAASERHPITVSANVAGVTRTRSMQHPLFQIAFDGAAHFGVEIFAPETTRWLNGLLLLHDLVNPEAPGSVRRNYGDDVAKARALRSQQVHGGLYALPFEVDGALRVATFLALAGRPYRLLSLLPGSGRPSNLRPAQR